MTRCEVRSAWRSKHSDAGGDDLRGCSRQPASGNNAV
jgi:hypothetical protein